MSIEGGVDRPTAVHAPSYFHVPKISYQYCAGCKFEEDLHETLKESLSLFPVVDLKVEQRLIVQILAGRDIFWQLPTGYRKCLTCCLDY